MFDKVRNRVGAHGEKICLSEKENERHVLGYSKENQDAGFAWRSIAHCKLRPASLRGGGEGRSPYEGRLHTSGHPVLPVGEDRPGRRKIVPLRGSPVKEKGLNSAVIAERLKKRNQSNGRRGSKEDRWGIYMA